MENSPVSASLVVTNKMQADLLAELLEKAAVAGPNAKALAYLYEEGQKIKAQFADGT
jgi:hypothetical protein